MKYNKTKLIFIEGVKNSGKTYLIENSKFPSYKFPFANYFNQFLKTGDNELGNGDKATYHFSTSFDVSLLSMHKMGLIKTPLLIDRGFLSNVALGTIQGRISDEEGRKYLDFLDDQEFYGATRVIYVNNTSLSGAGRQVPKDQWESLDRIRLHEKYMEYMEYMNEKFYIKCEFFNNSFDEDSLDRFKQIIK